MLSIEGINQYYGGSHILRDVSLALKTGECTVVLGRNGVGKTTLLKSIMGVVPVKSGRIVLDGHDITALAPYQRAALGIGYVPQGREIFNRLTVEDNLLMGLAPLKGAKARKLPEHILETFPVLKQMLRRRGGDLSGGQQQQLAIGRALMARPRLLLLDEPYAALDAGSRTVVERFLAERPAGLTVVMATHDAADAHRSDRVLELREGTLRLLHACAGHDHRHA